MFKVGDKVQIKSDQKFIHDVVYIHKEFKENGGRVHYMVAYKGDRPTGHWEQELILVESAPETEKEEVKMLKVGVKETKVEPTFPCIRKDKVLGSLHLFWEKAGVGFPLTSRGCSWWEDTEPFTGTVTLTQE